jgi:hypothetical protein
MDFSYVMQEGLGHRFHQVSALLQFCPAGASFGRNFTGLIQVISQLHASAFNNNLAASYYGAHAVIT